MIMYVNAAETMLVLLGIVIVVYGPLQAAIADFLRQRLFEQRDELFALAASGSVSFDHAAYRATRERINASICYAHRISLPRTIFLFWKCRSELNFDASIKFETVKNGQAREKMQNIMSRCERFVAFSLLARSPLVWMVAIIVVPICLLLALIKDGTNVTARFLEKKREVSSSVLSPLGQSVNREIYAASC